MSLSPSKRLHVRVCAAHAPHPLITALSLASVSAFLSEWLYRIFRKTNKETVMEYKMESRGRAGAVNDGSDDNLCQQTVN